MSEEHKWLLLFGRDWVQFVDIQFHENPEIRRIQIALSERNMLVYDWALDKVKLKVPYESIRI